MNLQKYHEAIRAFDKVLKIHPHDDRVREQMDLAEIKIMESCSFSPSFPGKTTEIIQVSEIFFKFELY